MFSFTDIPTIQSQEELRNSGKPIIPIEQCYATPNVFHEPEAFRRSGSGIQAQIGGQARNSAVIYNVKPVPPAAAPSSTLYAYFARISNGITHVYFSIHKNFTIFVILFFRRKQIFHNIKT